MREPAVRDWHNSVEADCATRLLSLPRGSRRYEAGKNAARGLPASLSGLHQGLAYGDIPLDAAVEREPLLRALQDRRGRFPLQPTLQGGKGRLVEKGGPAVSKRRLLGSLRLLTI